MKFLVVLSAVVACVVGKPGLLTPLAAPIAPGLLAPSALAWPAVRYAAPLHTSAVLPAAHLIAVAAPVTRTQYHAQDELGNAAFGHSEPGQVHTSVQDGLGNRVGSYSYWNPADGKVHRTDYVADSLGFRVAANDLPEGPAPVSDTPEVVAAREAHLALHRSRRSVLLQTPAATAPLATPLIARPLVAAPLIAAPLAPAPVVGAPIPLSAIPAGIPATLTTIVNNPGHAVSYRVD